jgi:5-methyltetrahydropteroyltriglutamate--homocysteine methyltransferase
MTTEKLLPTTVVGSYPQPDWLVKRDSIAGHTVPRIRQTDFWNVAGDLLSEAQDDATVLVIRAMEQAGIDIISDGEIRRESYSNRFATALAGIETERPGEVPGRSGGTTVYVPRVVGPIRRSRPVQVEDVRFLRRNTDRTIKVTVPGPFTMSQQAVDEHYYDGRVLALAYAAAVNEEVLELFDAGADVVQLDEPWLQARTEQAQDFGIEAVDRALEGVRGVTALHLCFGYAAMVKEKPSGYTFLKELEHCRVQQVSIEAAQPKLDLNILKQLPSKTIILGVLDLGDMAIEAPETVAQLIREALKHLPPERLILAPDCGMKYLPREVAYGKLQSLAEGAAKVRLELEIMADSIA